MNQQQLLDRAARHCGYKTRYELDDVFDLHRRSAEAFTQWQSLAARYDEVAEICHATKWEISEVDDAVRPRARRLAGEVDDARQHYEDLADQLRDKCIEHGLEHLIHDQFATRAVARSGLFAVPAASSAARIERIARRRPTRLDA